MNQPSYPAELVKPMRGELTAIGCEELLTSDDVEKAVSETKGVLMVVVNSVCGCAAGSARPGIALALQNKVIPDRITTVFAGMEKDAVNTVRALHQGQPPSSPCIVFFKEGSLMGMVHRSDIEGRDPKSLAEGLVKIFDDNCSKSGPSIPPEEFQKLEFVKVCGSQIPRMPGS